jgi:hypothetical protein
MWTLSLHTAVEGFASFYFRLTFALREPTLRKELEMKEPGLDTRHRDKTGEIERKKGNTRVESLRKTYGEDFLSDWRGDAHLETVLEEEGAESLSELIKDYRKKKK